MMFKVFNCHNYHELKNKFQVSKIGLLAQWVKFQKIFKDKTYFCDFFWGGGASLDPSNPFPSKTVQDSFELIIFLMFEDVSIVDIWFLISPLSWCFCVEQS